MPIYKITYSELWSSEYHIEARSTEEAEAVFTMAIDRYIIHPDEDSFYDSSTWTTEEVSDSHTPDVSYRDFEEGSPKQILAALCDDPDFEAIGIASLSRGVTDDYARTIWEKIKRNVAEDILVYPGIEEYSDDNIRSAIGRAMMKQIEK